MNDNAMERNRILKTMNECNILTLAPHLQDQIADKLLGEGFTAITVATLWREAKRTCETVKSASKTVVSLLRQPAESITRAIGNCKPEVAPGEANWRHGDSEPIDHERACRIAFCRVVADRVPRDVVAKDLGVPIDDIDSMVNLGREMQTTIIPKTKAVKSETDYAKEHTASVVRFRESMARIKGGGRAEDSASHA